MSQTSYAPLPGPILSIILTSTDDPTSELPSSISGTLANYRFVLSAPGKRGRLYPMSVVSWCFSIGVVFVVFDYEIAHPNMDNSTAKAILEQDFQGTFQHLHAAACIMANYLFED